MLFGNHQAICYEIETYLLGMEDHVDLALAALNRVMGLATGMGVRYKNPLLGELGTTLYLIKLHLINTADRQNETRILKLCMNWKPFFR